MRYVLLGLVCLAMSPLAQAEVMRAVVIGEGGGVKVASVPKPEPQAGQVRIKVRAASVNPVDWKLAARSAQGTIPGRDLAGVIDAVGPDAGGWKKGQAVIAVVAPGAGSYAEYAVALVKAIAPKPKRLSFEEAAGLPVVGETAWRAMVTVANVQPGQKVLIHGGAGGVGSSAVQIAKVRGAEVIATASPDHADLVRHLGAQEIIDYHKVRFEDQVHDMDVVLNTVDADTAVRSIKVVKPGGILVSVAGPAPAEQCADAKIRCAITGSVNGEMLGELSQLADRGQLTVHIDRKMTLDQVADAWRLSKEGHIGGKIILEVSTH
jgi:NADPH:quinone reductase-like Zn-dependent oxidoreductase